MGNKQGSLANHMETASKTGALAFPGKVKIKTKMSDVFQIMSFF